MLHLMSIVMFKGNTIAANSSAGVLFRNESEAMGAHRNVFENNRILDNGHGKDRAAAIVIEGSHHDLVFRENSIGNSKPTGGAHIGIHVRGQAPNLQADEKQFVNVQTPVDKSNGGKGK